MYTYIYRGEEISWLIETKPTEISSYLSNQIQGRPAIPGWGLPYTHAQHVYILTFSMINLYRLWTHCLDEVEIIFFVIASRSVNCEQVFSRGDCQWKLISNCCWLLILYWRLGMTFTVLPKIYLFWKIIQIRQWTLLDVSCKVYLDV